MAELKRPRCESPTPLMSTSATASPTRNSRHRRSSNEELPVSPRRLRIEVREQEKESIVDCHAISSVDGFTSLSSCNKEMFDDFQDDKCESSAATRLATANRAGPSKRVLFEQTQTRSMLMPPPLPRSPSFNSQSPSFNSHSLFSSADSASKCSSGTKEIRGFEAQGRLVTIKDLRRRPQSSRGNRSESSLSQYKPSDTEFCRIHASSAMSLSGDGSPYNRLASGVGVAEDTLHLMRANQASSEAYMAKEAAMAAREAAVSAREAAVEAREVEASMNEATTLTSRVASATLSVEVG